jgi:hypothetical protein
MEAIACLRRRRREGSSGEILARGSYNAFKEIKSGIGRGSGRTANVRFMRGDGSLLSKSRLRATIGDA